MNVVVVMMSMLLCAAVSCGRATGNTMQIAFGAPGSDFCAKFKHKVNQSYGDARAPNGMDTLKREQLSRQRWIDKARPSAKTQMKIEWAPQHRA